MTANTYGRQVVIPMTNKSGGSVAAGDVVVVDTSNNLAFTTTTTTGFTGGVGVVQETIASNAVGRVLLSGYAALVNVNASVTRGNFGKTHTVAKQATDAGSSRGTGTFCQFLTGGTTPDAVVYPVDLLGSSLTNPMTTSQDIIVGGASGAPGRLAKGSDGTFLGVVSGSVAYATPGSGAMTLISSSVLGSAAASFSFTSISGAYNHLRVMVVGRCSAAVFDSSVLLRFNSDSAANYDRYIVQGASATTANAAESFAQTSAYVGTVVGASGPASIPGIVIVEIPLYAGTTFHKTVMRLSGEVGQSTGNDRLEYGVATWRSTAAVTQIDLTLGSGTNFITGSAAYLYGLL